MRPLGRNRRIVGNGRFVRRASEFSNRALIDILQRGRGEVACIAAVNDGALERFVNNVKSRAELVFADERIHEVEAASEIDCELLERFPFVLHIEAVEVAIFVAVIDDVERYVARLIAVCIDGKHERGRPDGGVLFAEKKTAAKRVLVVELVARVQLDAV